MKILFFDLHLIFANISFHTILASSEDAEKSGDPLQKIKRFKPVLPKGEKLKNLPIRVLWAQSQSVSPWGIGNHCRGDMLVQSLGKLIKTCTSN